jgi:hypothetical protein
MKRKILQLSVAGVTFIIGVVSSMIWLQIPKLSSYNQQPITRCQSVQTFERIRVCSKRYDINLGDSFQQVSNVIPLNADPNGPNENVSWQAGKLTDFYSVGEPSIKIDEENELNPAIFYTFDDQQRLKAFYISWTYDGLKNDSIKQKTINTLFEKEYDCMGKNIDFNKNTYTDKVDFGNYVQEFKYDFSESSSFWSVSYSITIK